MPMLGQFEGGWEIMADADDRPRHVFIIVGSARLHVCPGRKID
jgi:hypothetical protein